MIKKGVTSQAEMHRHVMTFSEQMFADVSKTNKAFYPDERTVGNAMNRIKINKRFSDIDEINIRKLVITSATNVILIYFVLMIILKIINKYIHLFPLQVDKWQNENKEDLIVFRSKTAGNSIDDEDITVLDNNEEDIFFHRVERPASNTDTQLLFIYMSKDQLHLLRRLENYISFHGDM